MALTIAASPSTPKATTKRHRRLYRSRPAQSERCGGLLSQPRRDKGDVDRAPPITIRRSRLIPTCPRYNNRGNVRAEKGDNKTPWRITRRGDPARPQYGRYVGAGLPGTSLAKTIAPSPRRGDPARSRQFRGLSDSRLCRFSADIAAATKICGVLLGLPADPYAFSSPAGGWARTRD